MIQEQAKGKEIFRFCVQHRSRNGSDIVYRCSLDYDINQPRNRTRLKTAMRHGDILQHLKVQNIHRLIVVAI